MNYYSYFSKWLLSSQCSFHNLLNSFELHESTDILQLLWLKTK